MDDNSNAYQSLLRRLLQARIVRSLFQGVLKGAVISAVLCVIIALLAWMQARDQEVADELREAQEARFAAVHQAHNYATLLARCMNGGWLIDSVSNTAFFCGRAVEMKL